jgi:hypothetical protein
MCGMGGICGDALEVVCDTARVVAFPPGIAIEIAMDRRGDAVRGDPPGWS